MQTSQYQFFDAHIHSKYSHACSPYSTIDTIELRSIEKGITIAGTGDIFHPMWFADVSSYTKLNPTTHFLQGKLGLNFIPTTEVECKWDGYSVHNIIIFQSLEDVKFLRRILKDFSPDRKSVV